jgi:hypothetical protein
MSIVNDVRQVNWYLYPALSTRYEYTGGILTYEGIHQRSNASMEDTNWFVTKYFYTDGNLVYMCVKQGAWSQREALFSDVSV